MQYADFAVWQRQWLAGEALEAQLAYWREQLAGAPPLLELPTDRPRRARSACTAAARPLRASARSRARRCGRSAGSEGATLFMALLAGLQVLLARYTGRGRRRRRHPVAGPHAPELEGLIGFFVNTLVLRADLSGDPRFRELLGRVRETTLGAYAHQDLPFERLVEELAPEREPGATPRSSR